MADKILAFEGFEAAEQNEGNSRKGSSGQLKGLTKNGSVSTASIVTTPVLAGTYALEVDPVNGNTTLETYGAAISGFGSPLFLIVPFIYRFAVGFDAVVTLAEYHIDATTGGRRVLMNTNEIMVLQDREGDQIGIGSNALSVNKNYPMLWYLSLDGTTRDILWVYGLVTAGVWQKEVDVTDHGVVTLGTTLLTLGSGSGKVLPTSGGPMYYDEFAIIENPTSGGIGSVACKLLKANGNGADTGEWLDHAFGDVDEVPADLDGTSIDAGDGAGEKQSYDVEAPGETPLAMQIVGALQHSGTGTFSVKPYIFDGSNRDYGAADSYGTTFRQILHGLVKTKLPNGNAITESAVNDLEVGLEIVTIPASRTIDLDQIGLEYCVAGAVSLPSDFPADAGTGVEVLGPIFIT